MRVKLNFVESVRENIIQLPLSCSISTSYGVINPIFRAQLMFFSKLVTLFNLRLLKIIRAKCVLTEQTIKYYLFVVQEEADI